jgi:hypothetical protein
MNQSEDEVDELNNWPLIGAFFILMPLVLFAAWAHGQL